MIIKKQTAIKLIESGNAVIIGTCVHTDKFGNEVVYTIINNLKHQRTDHYVDN